MTIKCKYLENDKVDVMYAGGGASYFPGDVAGTTATGNRVMTSL